MHDTLDRSTGKVYLLIGTGIFWCVEHKKRTVLSEGSAMRRYWRVTAMSLVLAVSLGYALSCSRPTKPKEPKGLRLYVIDGSTNNIYVFDPKNKTLLDSMYADYCNGLILSEDGEYLFTTHDAPPMPGRQVLKKVQTETLEIVGEMPGIGQLLFLEQGEVLLRQGLDKIDYIDPISFQITDSDSISLGRIGSFDTLGFIVGRDPDNQLTTYDFRNKQVLDADSVVFPDGGFALSSTLALHPSGQHGFGIFRDSYQRAWFIDFTTPNIEIEFAFQIHHYFGDVAVSPDGRYVLFNDPGDPWHGNSRHEFYVYDVSEQRIIHIIRTDTLALMQAFPGGRTESIAFSPDGSAAYVSCGLSGEGPILYFDMINMAFTDEIHTNLDWTPCCPVVGYEP